MFSHPKDGLQLGQERPVLCRRADETAVFYDIAVDQLAVGSDLKCRGAAWPTADQHFVPKVRLQLALELLESLLVAQIGSLLVGTRT